MRPNPYTTDDGIMPLTDSRGALLVPSEEMTEPEPASVVLTDGKHGTAWQRYFTDELWHRVGGGRGRTWVELVESNRNLVLVYDAPVREGRES